MGAVLSPVWGPYTGVADAHDHLCRYVDKVCSPGVGIVWAVGGSIYPLRAPSRDGAGFGDVLIFEWIGLPPETPRPPSTIGGRVLNFIKEVLADQERAIESNANAYMAMNQTVNKAVSRAFTEHQGDGVGVALDVLCVALSLALIPTGLGLIGVAALVGGVVLLGADGTAYAMEMSGDEQGAEVVKRKTEGLRILATVMTLPDLAFGGFKAVRELQEVRTLRLADRATAQAAGKLGARTSSAERAQRYAQVAERANLRAQLRTQQITASLRLEITPRLGGAGSLGLLVKEEWSSDESAMRRFLSGLRLHATASHA